DAVPRKHRERPQIVQLFALMLLAVLTASVVGIEYGLGTLRITLVRGTGRGPYLTGKFLMLAVVAAVALLSGTALAAASSLVAGRLATSPPAGVAAPASWADAGIALAQTWGSLLPYLALTGCVTVLARSSAIGMAV